MKTGILFALAFAGALAAGSEPIRIGHVNSLTGPEASFGKRTDQGVRLAAREINEAGGVQGRRIEIVSVDDEGKSDMAVTGITKLITQIGVVAVIGESSSTRTLAIAPIAQQYRIPLVSPAATNPKVTQAGDFVFRVCFVDTYQGAVVAKFALERLKAKRVAILKDVKNDYSIGLAKYFTEALVKGGGTVVSSLSYSAGDVDFRAQLTAVRVAKPDAVFVPGYYTDVGLIIRQARELGLQQAFLGGDGWDSPSLLQIGGKAVEGTYFANHYSPDDMSPRVQDFIRRFRAEYHDEPNSSSSLGYDALRVIADALKRAAAPTSVALREALAATRDFPGVTGTITIDAQRNAVKPAMMLKVENGKIRFASKVDL